MKKILAFLGVALVVTGAMAGNKPIQLSLTPDIDLVDRSETIEGLTLSIWGENPQTALAQYYIAVTKDKTELDKALDITHWVTEHALPSGVLAEQVNPLTNEPLSVSPLTWSHATYVAVVQEYLDKLLETEKCADCGLSKYSKYARKVVR